jgi:replicative DNA helicase Mcm
MNFQAGRNLKYMERIREMLTKNEISLYVDFDDLLNYDRKLTQDLLEDPDAHLAAANDALKSIIEVHIGSPFSGYLKYIRDFRIRFRGVPKETRVNIYNIRARHINKLITVEGVVMKSIMKYEIIGIVFYCRYCKKEFKIQLDSDGMITPRPFCAYCDNAYTTYMVDIIFSDVLHVLIEPENLSQGSRSLEILIKDNLVDITKDIIQLNNKIIVTGILRPKREDRKDYTIFEKVRSEDDTLLRFSKSYDAYIEAHDIELKEKAANF